MPARGSARARRQRAVLKTGALQTAILNSENFSSIATDEHGVIQVFNVGAARMLGYDAADVVDRITPAELSDPLELVQRAHMLSTEFGQPIAPGFEALVFKASRGIEDIYELTYLRQDGSRLPAVVSVTALRGVDDALIGYLLIGTDNTARKRVEAEQARLDEALQRSNLELQAARIAADTANQAKSDFLSRMSHELRSPLNAILGFAQLMESGTPEPTAAQKDSIVQILHAGWYLLELINEILDLALIESGKLSLSPEPMSMAEVLADCQAMTEPQASAAGIALHFFPPVPDLFVRADRTRVKQICLNLLSNAIKYNRSGGKVEVRCSTRPNGRVRVGFRDTGAGLAPDQVAQLFQPFNRLGQETGLQQGTGIGLVVCQQLVRLMGGEIGVVSEPGVGSEFWIDLLASHGLAQPAEAELANMQNATVPAAGAPLRSVLYVEDNPANLLLVTRLLARRPDLHLLSATDGRSGVELARATRPTVILMDINLPGISGVTALKLLAADPATAHIPVVALSANAMPNDIAKGMAAGFLRYITKPIRVAELMDTIDLALAAGTADTAAPQVQPEQAKP
ncbi:MAG: ATP-binding protein [Rubrivivax sp.]|nr:ATP-binding protein [Rubrivivax sp.]